MRALKQKVLQRVQGPRYVAGGHNSISYDPLQCQGSGPVVQKHFEASRDNLKAS
jgi:hypothetical protein